MSISSSPSDASSQVNQAVLRDVVQNIALSAVNRGNKRRHSQNSESDTESGSPDPSQFSYMTHGRIYMRQEDPFSNIYSIVVQGIKVETEDTDDEQPHPNQRTQRAIESWKTLCKLIPKFRIQMINLSSNTKLLKRVCQELSEGANSVRADDAASLKGRIISYLLLDKQESSALPIPRSGSKFNRGWENETTAALLCPLKYPATQQTFDEIKAGLKVVTATTLPRFLYPAGQVYDPENFEDGILRGHLMLRVAKHIFQGPSAALEPAGFHRGRQGNAALANITSMTPKLIAYVAIQTRFALTSQQTWSKQDACFDYEEFYWGIVDIFEDGEGADIIALYNHEIFGVTPPSMDMSGNDMHNMPTESDFARLKAQRAAKRARMAAVGSETSD